MARKIVIILMIAAVLVACGQKATPEPTATPVPDTATPAPTKTPPPPTPTETPLPTPVVIFEDDFDGELKEGWTWVREERQRWSLTDAPGFLQILLQPYGLGSGNPHNLLLRDAPEGPFEIETYLVFEPRSNYQIAGILVYQDDKNAVQLGRAFCDAPNGCVGNGLYFDSFNQGNFEGDNFSINTQSNGTVYLRIRREAQTFTAYYSEDGIEWIVMGSHDNPLSVDKVGIVAGQSYEPAVFAQFDYFKVYQLPE